VAQKRLLVVSTAQFTNFITQSNLDQDSVMAMACRITGMPFLLPYSDGFTGKASGGEDLINLGRIPEAIRFSDNCQGEQQIQLLLELGIWYLHQPGTHKKDLDAADFYIEKASTLSRANKNIKWEKECQFALGELYQQKGNAAESKTIFMQQLSSGQQQGDFQTAARAYQHLAGLLPLNDSMKRVYYQRSLELYQKLQLKEKEIELLWNISFCDIHVGNNAWENDLRQIIALMQSTGFKHVLYAENVLSLILGRQGKYLDAFVCTNAALENLKWSGIDAVAGSMYLRAGNIEDILEKPDEALAWYKKALDTRKNETHVFWYKSLFAATTILMDTHPEEALSLMNTITSQFPPKTVWEQLQILSIKGECYRTLNKPGLTDDNYMSFLKLSNQYPSEDSHGELAYTDLAIGEFYISRSNAKKARLFFQKADTKSESELTVDAIKYLFLYRLDSLEGNYKSALQNHIKYKFYEDSNTGIDQLNKVNELRAKYASEKKDQDIKLLTQQGLLQQGELRHNQFTKNIMIAGTILMSVIIILLFGQFRMKQRTNKEMNKRNLALKQLIDDKEWLIKEVHHRVKNNLQTIISLLESQAAYLESDALKAIATSQNRIYTMSLIHQKLYQSEDIQTINMAEYIPELVKYLKELFDNSHKIDFTVEVDPVNLDASIAVPLALIINEALTNSIKYAFPNKRHGQILISLREEDDSLKLELADNGIGMDLTSIKTKPVSLGIQLIKGLTKEIHGDVIFESNHGVKITLLFKKIALEYANIFESDIMTLV